MSSGEATSQRDEVCTVCGYVIRQAVGISFKTLTVDGNRVYGKVANDAEYYSFIDEVVMSGGAKYVVSLNITGSQPVYAKTIDLAVGDNTVYIIELVDDEPTNIYIVNIRRRPMYEVKFNTGGGTAVNTLTVEEDTILTAPETSRAGYTFAGWDYDFTTPITKNITVLHS